MADVSSHKKTIRVTDVQLLFWSQLSQPLLNSHELHRITDKDFPRKCYKKRKILKISVSNSKVRVLWEMQRGETPARINSFQFNPWNYEAVVSVYIEKGTEYY